MREDSSNHLRLELIRQLLEAIYAPSCSVGFLEFYQSSGEDDEDSSLQDVCHIPLEEWGTIIFQFQERSSRNPIVGAVHVLVDGTGAIIDPEHFVINGDPRDFPTEFFEALRGALTVAIQHCTNLAPDDAT